jgi:predicted Zn finger-like uncharacterized protein
MALATQCPHCGTVFRVAADQLKLRGGIVRCGACQLIFDGNAGLVERNAAPAAPVPAVPITAPSSEAPAVAENDTDTDTATQPVYTLEFDHMLSPHGILPQAQPDTDGAATAIVEQPADDAQDCASAPDGADATPPPEPVHEAAKAAADDAPPMLLRESAGGSPPIVSPAAPLTPRARAAEARTRRAKAPAPRVAPGPKAPPPDADEPAFVRQGRQREQTSKVKRIAFALGSLVLLILGAQAVLGSRDVLAARYPALRPALASSCALLGCRIELPARPDQLVIETGELITLGGNAYTFSTLLRNQGDMALAWPSIELTLNDADDKPLVRRVFGPREYAGAAAASPNGFGARAEQPVKIHFRLEGLEPSGYHIAVFYP